MSAPEVHKIGRDHYAVVTADTRIWSVAKLPAREGGQWVVFDPSERRWRETFGSKDEAIAAVAAASSP